MGSFIGDTGISKGQRGSGLNYSAAGFWG